MVQIQPEYHYKLLGRIDPKESTGLMDMLASGGKELDFVPPVSSRILLYCWGELSNARDQGDYRPEWSALFSLLVEASELKPPVNPQALCEVLFQIGQLCGVLAMPSWSEIAKGFDARKRVWKLDNPRIERTLNQKVWIGAAQELAVDIWKEDTNKKIRISQMAELVWSILIEAEVPEDVLEQRPDRAEKLKPWLRKVAPDYAKKGGAPKKDKK